VPPYSLPRVCIGAFEVFRVLTKFPVDGSNLFSNSDFLLRQLIWCTLLPGKLFTKERIEQYQDFQDTSRRIVNWRQHFQHNIRMVLLLLDQRSRDTDGFNEPGDWVTYPKNEPRPCPLHIPLQPTYISCIRTILKKPSFFVFC
jgi:hypothetical protein